MYYSLSTNAQRAKNAITLIWIVLALEIATLISSCLQYNLLESAASGIVITDAAAEANDLRVRMLAILYLVAYVISAITFIMWFRRAFCNLQQRAAYLQYSDGWAAGSWFVPILNLFRPYQIMNEMYSETRRLLQSKGFPEINLTTRLLAWWWALWIISRFVGQAAFRFSLSAETVDELITATMIDIVNTVVGIPLALLAIKVIKDYAAVEPLLNDITEDAPVTGTIQYVQQPEEADTETTSKF